MPGGFHFLGMVTGPFLLVFRELALILALLPRR